MTKADIAERIQSKLGFSKKGAVESLELVLDIIKKTLESGETVKIARFGRFEIQHKKERRGRNPHTGVAI